MYILVRTLRYLAPQWAELACVGTGSGSLSLLSRRFGRAA